MSLKRLLAGRVLKCPSCHGDVRYSWLSGMTGPHLHFYANDSNDVLVRESWFRSIAPLLQQGAPEPTVITEINALLKGVSGASSKYAVWNNVKCPHCKNEFPYRFKGSLKLRLEDHEVILIDGCLLDTDSGVYLIEVNPVRDGLQKSWR